MLASLKNPRLLKTLCYVDGQWIGAASTATLEVDNPATGEVLASVPAFDEHDTLKALDSSHAAGLKWAVTPVSARSQVLERWYALIVASTDDLAIILTLEQGKPLAEARGEIAYAASFIKWFAEEARRGYGDEIPSPAGDRRILATREPVGLSVAITPWNFPAAMITRKAGAALAAGCAMVVKPSELTPLTALALAALAEEAGVPPGVLAVVTGLPAGIGKAMTGSPLVRKLSFTGSTKVGRLLMEQCAPTLKRLSLELGGNAPFIVFDDADIDLAVSGLMASKFRNGGQTCVCANRVLVQDGIFDAFAARLGEAVAALKVGNGLDAGTTVGPLINNAAVDKVNRHVDDALSRGARRYGSAPGALHGRFVSPVVLTDARSDMLLASEETFGPVAPLFRFRTDDEAIELANGSESGLAAYFYTRDLKRTWEVSRRLETGMVGVNTGAISLEVAPFGGVKQSGFGREGSKFGLDEYQAIKTLHLAL